jgi:hypothetical protein
MIPSLLAILIWTIVRNKLIPSWSVLGKMFLITMAPANLYEEPEGVYFRYNVNPRP